MPQSPPGRQPTHPTACSNCSPTPLNTFVRGRVDARERYGDPGAESCFIRTSRRLDRRPRIFPSSTHLTRTRDTMAFNFAGPKRKMQECECCCWRSSRAERTGDKILTSKGMLWEMEDAVIDGQKHKVWKNVSRRTYAGGSGVPTAWPADTFAANHLSRAAVATTHLAHLLPRQV